MAKNSMKKLLLVMVMIILLCVLSSCSFSDLMSKGTGVTGDPDYQTWEKLSENGKLNKEGKYTSDAVHVTFARNGYVEAKFFRDPEMKDEITEGGCYLFPGDVIYYQAKTKPGSDQFYLYDHLDVIEYSDQNVRGSKLNWAHGDPDNIIIIPNEFTGTEVSVEPIGYFKKVTVRLEHPAYGGSVKYYANDEELIGDTAELYCGTVIKGELKAYSGWKLEVGENPTYIVTDDNNQTATFQRRRANEYFTEEESHKPTLKVEINSNLGTCKCVIETTGYLDEVSYNGNGIIIDNKKIATGEGIKLTFKNFAFDNDNNAARVKVVKTANSKEFTNYYYAVKGKETVYINLDKEVHYNNVYIVIDAVKAEPFVPISCENADIYVSFTDVSFESENENGILEPGEYATADRKIAVSIVPHKGFILSGQHLTEKNEYYRVMSFNEYNKYVEEAIRTELKKMCTIHLDSNDDYGIVGFKVDDHPCTGDIEIMEGKNLTILYTLSNDDYVIDEPRNIIDQGNVFDPDRFKKYEKTIRIEADMDGRTIRRVDFITIKPKEKKVN